jgi:hypothetical protein
MVFRCGIIIGHAEHKTQPKRCGCNQSGSPLSDEVSSQSSKKFLKHQDPPQAEKVTPESDKPIATEPNAIEPWFGRAMK